MLAAADDALGHLRAARAHQAEQADDLAFAHVEADALQKIGAQIFDAEDVPPRGGDALGVHVLDLAADHVGDELVGIGILHRYARHLLAIAHDHDVVAISKISLRRCEM